MFTIDLLKGEGVPIKSGPEGIVVAVAASAAPVIIAIVMFGLYLSNRIAISIQKQEIVNYQTKANELSDALEFQKTLLNEKNDINRSLSEVSSSIARHSQWSPVLATLVENMPDSMVLTDLEVKQRSVKMKVPKKDDPKTQVDISVPQRTLRVTISVNPGRNCNKEVTDFRDRLRFSSALRTKLEDVRVSQDVGRLEGQEVVSYEIECIFKPAL
ncbi:MAG TPA: hypothetical protein VMW16_16275 [Sedimentisphaerales bacterium]|nr:hypothetical protein [Sedimentisphaerales bacterium]